jgi:hypothetical protein
VNGWSVETRRCFIGDGGWPSGVGLQGLAANRHKLLGSRALVVSVVEKAEAIPSGRPQGDERE